MSKILSREYVTIAVLILVILSGTVVHSPQFNTIGRKPVPVAGRSAANIRDITGESQLSTFYMANNLSVPAGTTLVIRNENVILQSLTLKTIGMNVSGKLEIIDSTITLSNASYSAVKDLNMSLDFNSTFFMLNSTITAPGTMVFNGTNATIQNSTINSSISGSQIPSEQSMTFDVYDSTMNLDNSSLSGLYIQKSPVEYTDGTTYLYASGFSQAATVPMKTWYSLRNGSYIKGVNLNVTYYGNTNETTDNLMVYYNNTFLENLYLPYNTNETSSNELFSLNFSRAIHNFTWMVNQSNFRFVLNMTYSTGIALTNFTADFISNDTVSLYGQKYYSYIIENSTMLVYNSTLGLNYDPYSFANGEPNYHKNSLLAYNSSILMGDSVLSDVVTYVSPFFRLYDSSLYLFKEVTVNSSFLGIPYHGLNYSISPTNTKTGSVQDFQYWDFSLELAKTGSSWLNSSTIKPALYETNTGSSNWNYTDSFSVNASPGVVAFSVEPFPVLSRTLLNVNYTLEVPNADFILSGKDSVFNGNLLIDYTGNLTGLGSINVTWEMKNNNGIVRTGNLTFLNPEKYSNFTIDVGPTDGLIPGNYTLSLHADTTGPHVFQNNILSTAFTIYAPVVPVKKRITVRENGLTNGTIWGLSFNNTEYFSSSSNISFVYTNNSSFTILIPHGYRTNSTVFLISPGIYNYAVSFSKVYYTLTFHNTQAVSGKEWKVLVDGHTYMTNMSTISVSLVPGVYNYEVIDPSNYYASNSTGIINLTSSHTVQLVSKEKSMVESKILHLVERPLFFIPTSIISIILSIVVPWLRLHSWYICKKCGATKKRRREKCHICELWDAEPPEITKKIKEEKRIAQRRG